VADDRIVEQTHILVIDADDTNRATLCRSLTGTGLSHACVRSGPEALDKLNTNAFTVALLDSSLADADGTDPGPGFRFDDLAHAAVAHAQESAIAHMQVRERAGMRAGGFGLMLVRALADVLMYNERGNEVTFVKCLGPGEYIGRPSSLSM